MALVKGIGGMVSFTEVKDASGADQDPDIPDWDGQTPAVYDIDDVVKISAGTGVKYFIAKISHTARAADSTGSGAATTLTPDRWRQVPGGNVTNLISWSLDETATTENKQVLYEETARTVGTTVAATGQLVFSFEDKDAIQERFRARNTGVITIYRSGIESDKPRIQFQAEITGRSDQGDENVQDVTIDYAASGTITRDRTS